ncbi:MAG: hypothetical protein SGI74_13190 [Oligoflexia bacterium]|nr:hypothetical protein [Oligoflexia bacterium]
MHSQMAYQKKEINSHLLGSDQRLLDFLYDSPTAVSLRDRPEILLDDSWEFSLDERVLIRAALDISCGGGLVFLGELLSDLSEKQFECLIKALTRYREMHQSIQIYSGYQKRLENG